MAATANAASASQTTPCAKKAGARRPRRFARERDRQGGEPADHDRGNGQPPRSPMDATPVPCESRDWYENEGEAGRNHVQRKQQRQPQQNQMKRKRQRQQTEPERDRNQRRGQHQEEQSERNNNGGQ